MKNIKIQSLLFLLLLSVYSCQYNSEEQRDEAECEDTISYINTVRPIIENNCLGCHNGNQSPNLSTFLLVKSNAEKFKEEVVARRMPKNGTLTNIEIEAIKCWVENGSLNN